MMLKSVNTSLSAWGRFSALLPVLLIFLTCSSVVYSYIAGDLDGNHKVDSIDLRLFAGQWLDEDCLDPGCDADIDNVNGVNMDDLALLARSWQIEEAHLVINEFMASNDSEEPLEEGELLDGNGESSDWIEIYNPTDSAVNLDGWYLTISDVNLTMWQFPDVELASGDFLIVFASEKTQELYPYNYPFLDPAGYYHTNFELDPDGGYLALVAPDGNTVIHEYGTVYPQQLTNVSYGLSQYGRVLISSSETASYHVPDISDAGTDWTDVYFDDSGWQVGKTCIGFGFGDVPMTAYNDCVYQSGDQYIGDNVTTYGIGEGFAGLTSGPLIDTVTGDNMGITATLTQSGGVRWQADPGGGGSDCAVGTDAYNTFGGIADMLGVIYYGSTIGWWVDLTFTGLDPATEYTFATSANRGEPTYTNRRTIYTITGADTYTNASTSGVETIADNSVRFNTGYNYSTGYVARWTGITASDGTFTVRAEADPSSESGYKAYTFDVFKLDGGFQGTNVEDDMLGINASIWIRTEFNLEDGESEVFDSLTLRMKYEDGFAAYLNGQQVTSRNAPEPVQWNSSALTDRPIEQSAEFEPINITTYVHSLQDGKNVLAIHGLNDGEADPNFLILPELEAAKNQAVPQYFTQPTPGKFNVPGAIGVVSDVWFSESRGFYDAGFQLTLSTADNGAEIRYTTDGSRPTITHGLIYAGPIDVNITSTIRAIAVKPGWLDSKVETHTYIFLDDVIEQSPYGEVPPGWPPSGINGQVLLYGMDSGVVRDPVWGPQLRDALTAIPTMSIVTDMDNLFDPVIGIYVNAGNHGYAWERPTSLELIYPPNPEGPGFPDLVPDAQAVTGFALPADMRDGFQIDAGLRIRGGFSRSDGNPKHAFRLFFRNEYGAGKLRYPLFGDEGVDGFDKVDLRTAQNYSWSFQNDSYNTMCRDVWARDTQGLMGQAYTRSRYYHIYINGQYWGVFQTQERPEAAFGTSYFSGDREQWDCVKATGPNAGYTIEATDGTLDYWQDLWELTNNLPGATVSQRTALYFQMQGLNADGTRNPGYPVLLDVDNLIDYMVMVIYDGDLDAPVSWFLGNDQTNNWYGIRYRPGEEGFKYFVHDAEHVMKAAERTAGGIVNRTGPYIAGLYFQYSNPQWIHQRLMLVPEYCLRFADHAHKHMFNSGLLTSNAAVGRFLARSGQIDMAIIAESARWGSLSLNKNTWLNAINNEVGNFFPTRAGIVINQLKNTTLWDGGSVAPLYPNVSAPTFSQNGGDVPGGFSLSMSASSGDIYYTIDGTDPRQPVTGNPVGIWYNNNPITLTKSTHVKARAYSGGAWSALNEAVLSVGPVVDNLRITEIMYHPKNTGNIYDPNTEYIELKNIGPDTINLNLVKFTEGIDFTFPSIELESGEHIVVVKDIAAFEAKYGTSVAKTGPYTGSLANDGEHIRLVDAIGRTILDFEYKDGWYPITDGDGFSLTIIEPSDLAVLWPDEGLVAHWELDDEPGSTIAIDSAGDNDGILYGNPVWTSGRIGGALSFDGSGDYVRAGSVDPLAGNSLTAQAWIRISESAGSWNPVIIQPGLSSSDGYYFYVSNNKPAFYIINGSNVASAISQEILTRGRWYHIAGTNDGSNLKVYVDGKLKASASSVGFTGVSGNAYIACEPVTPLYYAGLIDDVRIYNRALSDSEFQNIDDPMGRWSQENSWRASVYRNGTPGWDDSGILPNPGDIVVNEVMSHSNTGPDWIELYNTTSRDIDISGWFISDSDRDEPNLTKYRIANGTKIFKDSFLVFYENTSFGNAGDPGCLIPFVLSENGEKACLSSRLDPNGMLTGYREVEDFGASATNVSFGRYYLSSTGTFNFVAMDYNTPNLPNAEPRVGPIVINEIMYNPPTGNQTQEYIELYNITSSPVTLYRADKLSSWKFTDGIDYTFSSSPPITILGNGYLLVVNEDPDDFIAAFVARYGYPLPPTVQVVGGYDGYLSNSGERLQIGMPGDVDEEGTRYYIRIDRVTYSDGSHPEDCPGGIDLWPKDADGLGKSLSRKVSSAYGNDVANWKAASPTPGLSNP